MYEAQWDDSDPEKLEMVESFGIDLDPLPEVVPDPDNKYVFRILGWSFDLRDDNYEFSVDSVKAWVAWVAFLKSREKVNGTLDAPLRLEPKEEMELTEEGKEKWN
jgi:hypothetical protein